MEQSANGVTERLEALQEDAVAFWLAHAPDRDYGGFHGALDEVGNPDESADKGVIQQSRHLWTFSELYRHHLRTPEIRALCDDLYEFIITHFRDPDDGEFFFQVERDGSVSVAEKRLYSNSFAIYGLTHYALAVREEDPERAQVALGFALDAFHSMDRRTHDEVYGGFDQSREPNWLPPDASKGTNTHMHLVESFSSLLEATGDEVVRARLEELVEVFLGDIIQGSYAHVHFEADWTPVGDPLVEYGHDLQAAWLLLEAARVLDRLDDEKLLERVTAIAEASSREGYDHELGGYFYDGRPGDAVQDTAKVWWVQAEALNGLWWTYRLTGDPVHLARLEGTLSWIENVQRAASGEWYWEVDPTGQPVGWAGPAMSNLWKASYHTLRALMFVQRWMECR
jgi:cellobiose epimerase